MSPKHRVSVITGAPASARRWVLFALGSLAISAAGACSSDPSPQTNSVAPASPPAGAASPPPPAPKSHANRGSAALSATARAALTQLQADTGVVWDLNGKVLSARTDSGVVLGPNDRADDVAMAFLEKYGAILDIADAPSEFALNHKNEQMPGGAAIAFFDQRETGIPVYRAHLTAAYNSRRQLSAIGSGYVPGAHGLSPVPKLTASAAEAAARADAPVRYGWPTGRALIATNPTLLFYPKGQVVTLAYQVSVGARDQGPPLTAKYFIDANTGGVLYTERGEADAQTPAGSPVTESGGGEQPDTGPGSIPGAPAQSFTSYVTAPIPGGPRNRYYASYMQTLQPTNPVSWGTPLAPQYAWNQATNIEIAGSVRYSPSATSTWDAQAVDAYSNLYWANYWWANEIFEPVQFKNAAYMAVNVHTAGQFNQAQWSGAPLPQFYVFDPAPVAGVTQFPSSVCRDVMGHEYWHSVNDATLQLIQADEEGPLNESLGDVFGNLVENDLPPNTYTPTIWTFGEATVGPGSTSPSNYNLRNLKDPHQSGTRTGPQADNMNDPLYPWDTGDLHAEDGVPNNAWYLSVFGGTNTTSQITVPSATSVGYTMAETLYNLAATDPMVPVTSFLSFAEDITTLSTVFGVPSSTAAIACAWYAVGVMLPEEALYRFNVSSCQCANVPDGTYCGQTVPSASGATFIGTQQMLYTCSGHVLTDTQECPTSCIVDVDATGLDRCDLRTQDSGTGGGSSSGNSPPGDAGTPCNGLASGTYCGNDLFGGTATPGLYSCDADGGTPAFLGNCDEICITGLCRGDGPGSICSESDNPLGLEPSDCLPGVNEGNTFNSNGCHASPNNAYYCYGGGEIDIGTIDINSGGWVPSFDYLPAGKYCGFDPPSDPSLPWLYPNHEYDNMTDFAANYEDKGLCPTNYCEWGVGCAPVPNTDGGN